MKKDIKNKKNGCQRYWSGENDHRKSILNRKPWHLWKKSDPYEVGEEINVQENSEDLKPKKPKNLKIQKFEISDFGKI